MSELHAEHREPFTSDSPYPEYRAFARQRVIGVAEAVEVGGEPCSPDDRLFLQAIEGIFDRIESECDSDPEKLQAMINIINFPSLQFLRYTLANEYSRLALEVRRATREQIRSALVERVT